jgi:DNA-binding response OmpR family regulator
MREMKTQDIHLPRVLLIDEDASFAAVYEAALVRAGFRPSLARDADSAKQAVSQFDFAVIVTEVLLPGRNGLRLIQDLRLDTRLAETPILIVTVLEAADVGLYASLRESLGIKHYLVKQKIRPAQLVEAVRSVVTVT